MSSIPTDLPSIPSPRGRRAMRKRSAEERQRLLALFERSGQTLKRLFGLSEQTRVYLKTGVTDGRLGIDGLRGLVSSVLRQDVLAGHVFVFCNGRRNRIRCLLWDGSGFWLATKRLERATFDWPKDPTAMSQMSLVQLRLLLEGFELRSRRGWQRYERRLHTKPQPEVIAVRECQSETLPVSD